MTELIQEVLANGSTGIISLLVLLDLGLIYIIHYLIREIRSSQETLKRQREDIQNLTTKYQETHLATTEIMKEIEKALIEITSQL